jgi:hypothetical protein
MCLAVNSSYISPEGFVVVGKVVEVVVVLVVVLSVDDGKGRAAVVVGHGFGSTQPAYSVH